jgi:magnesium-protoporphyrin IX monomethyl ester (oxidative) cyclase
MNATASATATVAGRLPNESTQRAQQDTMLSPRFYKTDFEAMDRINVNPIRGQFDALMAEFEADNNEEHFQRPANLSKDYSHLQPPLYDEFLDFLISSVTSEFSGCVLYNDIKKRAKNPDVIKVFGYMARDEARHAGFINQWLKDFGVAVDLGFLTRAKKYRYFAPKFIYYATYLSEKIGYARYITIFRQVERHPELRFHPIFQWFDKWCHDEYRHGEAFALLMKAEPTLVQGRNRLWIRFFLLAVFATMYVRDHCRPALHDALGFDATEYDMQVFRITTEISKQIFPISLDIENPKFRAGLEKLVRINTAVEAAKARGGIVSWLERGVLATRGFFTFAGLYLMPVKSHDLPDDVRLAPTW